MAFTADDVLGRSCVILDFDGTIADTMEAVTRVARQVLHEHGFDDERIGDARRLVGPPFPQAFSMVYGVSPEEAAQITADYRAIYNGIGAEAWPAFDGMAEALIRLRSEGCELAVASSKGQRLVERGLSDNGMAQLFGAVEGRRSDVASEKWETLQRTVEVVSGALEAKGLPGVTADDCVMVGDRRFDVEAAARLGMPCIGVTWGGTCEREELGQAGAAVIVDTPQQMVRAILG